MVLEKILAEKRDYIERMKKISPEGKRDKDFSRETVSLKKVLDEKTFSVIAEIKRSSPSAGKIRAVPDPGKIAAGYSAAGAAGISVLTCEPFFNGSMKDLQDVRKVVSIPILMKDFVIDKFQVFEGRRHGADVLLLIMRILDDSEFAELAGYAESLGLEILAEVHTKEEMERALRIVKNWNVTVLGINNRNLETLRTDLDVTQNLMKFAREYKITAISESGIRTREDICLIRNTGVKGILVGESLLKYGSPGDNLKKILS